MKATSKAIKLLDGHNPDFLWGDIGIRDNEHDSMTHARVLDFIRAYPVLDVSIGHNNYGEFQFVSLEVICYNDYGHAYKELLQFWGNGYHEYRGTMQVNWRINVGNHGIYKNNRAMTKTETLRLISERRQELGITSKAKQESSNNLFGFMADISDEDSAYTMLDDMGEL